MSMHAIPECEQSQKNCFRGVSRPWQFTILMLCALPMLPGFVQSAFAGPPSCPDTNLVGAASTGGGASTLYGIEPATGAATSIGPIGFKGVSGMDFDSTGVLYATGANSSDNQVLIIINPCTGAGTEVGLTNIGFDKISDIAFRKSDNVLFAYKEPGEDVGTINLTSGALTVFGNSGLGPVTNNCCGNGIAFSSSNILYHGNDEALHTLDQGSGVATTLGSLTYSAFVDGTTPGTRPSAMKFKPRSQSLYAAIKDNNFGFASEDYFGIINITTFHTTVLGPTVSGLDAIAWYPDADGDGILDANDSCPDDISDTCNLPVANAEALSGTTSIPAAGSTIWLTATFTNSSPSSIITPRPTCFNTNFDVRRSDGTLVLPRILEGPAVVIPDNLVVIGAGQTFLVNCDLSQQQIPSRLVAGSYTVQATYFNDVNPADVDPIFTPPPGVNVFLGANTSDTLPLEVGSGTPVTQVSASVFYSPSVWSSEWAISGGPEDVKADITLTAGCTGFNTSAPITMNGSVAGAYMAGSTSTHAVAAFSPGAAVLSLGTTSPGIYSPTVQGSCTSPPGAFFTAQGLITLGLTVPIDIMPGTSPNRINAGSTGVVPVAIFSTSTFDATKVIPATVTLAGGTVKVKSVKGKATLQFSIRDLNGDGRLDMVLQIDTTTMTLDNTMTSAVLEGQAMNAFGAQFPIYGTDAVIIVK